MRINALKNAKQTAKDSHSATFALAELAKKIPLGLYSCVNLPKRNETYYANTMLGITCKLTVVFGGGEHGDGFREYRINDDPRVFKTLAALLAGAPAIASEAARRYMPGREKRFQTITKKTKEERK